MAEQKLTTRLDIDKSGYDRKLSDAEKGMERFGSAVMRIAGSIAAAFSVGAIVNFTKESMKLAAQMEGVASAFKTLDQPGLLSDLQRATRGTVDNLTLMQKAVQAKNFKIPLSQLATYFEFATKRAIQTGESVDYLVNSIITGIGRKSVLVMDNLGISAVELQKEVEKVGDFGIATGNIIQRELGAMGDVADTAAVRFQTFATAVSNLKEAWGSFLNDSEAIKNFLDNITRRIQILSNPDIPLIGWKRPTKANMAEWNASDSLLRQNRLNVAEAMFPGFTDRMMGVVNAKESTSVQATTAQISAEEQAIRDLIDKINSEAAAAEQLAKAWERVHRSIGGTPVGQAPVPGKPSSLGYTAPNLAGLQPSRADEHMEVARQIQWNIQNEEKMTKALQQQEYAVNLLSDAFMALFDNTGNGFDDMIDTMIKGIERLVAEMIAKELVTKIVEYFGGDTGLLDPIFGLFRGGGSTSSLGGTPSGAGGGAMDYLNFNSELKGKDIAISLRRV